MQDDFALDQMQSTYRAAVEEWIAAIRAEEELASVNHSIADVDVWEGAHFREEELRNKVKAAKKTIRRCFAQKILRLLAICTIGDWASRARVPVSVPEQSSHLGIAAMRPIPLLFR